MYGDAQILYDGIFLSKNVKSLSESFKNGLTINFINQIANDVILFRIKDGKRTYSSATFEIKSKPFHLVLIFKYNDGTSLKKMLYGPETKENIYNARDKVNKNVDREYLITPNFVKNGDYFFQAILGNGNCMFTSLLVACGFGGEKNQVNFLRKLLVSGLETNYYNLKDFRESVDSAITVYKYDGFNDIIDINSYIGYMSQDKAWGDAIMLQMFSYMYGIGPNVFIANKYDINYKETKKNEIKSEGGSNLKIWLRLSYSYDGNGKQSGHYDAYIVKSIDQLHDIKQQFIKISDEKRHFFAYDDMVYDQLNFNFENVYGGSDQNLGMGIGDRGLEKPNINLKNKASEKSIKDGDNHSSKKGGSSKSGNKASEKQNTQDESVPVSMVLNLEKVKNSVHSSGTSKISKTNSIYKNEKSKRGSSKSKENFKKKEEPVSLVLNLEKVKDAKEQEVGLKILVDAKPLHGMVVENNGLNESKQEIQKKMNKQPDADASKPKEKTVRKKLKKKNKNKKIIKNMSTKILRSGQTYKAQPNKLKKKNLNKKVDDVIIEIKKADLINKDKIPSQNINSNGDDDNILKKEIKEVITKVDDASKIVSVLNKQLVDASTITDVKDVIKKAKYVRKKVSEMSVEQAKKHRLQRKEYRQKQSLLVKSALEYQTLLASGELKRVPAKKKINAIIAKTKVLDVKIKNSEAMQNISSKVVKDAKRVKKNLTAVVQKANKIVNHVKATKSDLVGADSVTEASRVRRRVASGSKRTGKSKRSGKSSATQANTKPRSRIHMRSRGGIPKGHGLLNLIARVYKTDRSRSYLTPGSALSRYGVEGNGASRLVSDFNKRIAHTWNMSK